LYVRRFHASFHYQAQSWDRPRRVVAKVEWHPGELYPRVGFISPGEGDPRYTRLRAELQAVIWEMSGKTHGKRKEQMLQRLR